MPTEWMDSTTTSDQRTIEPAIVVCELERAPFAATQLRGSHINLNLTRRWKSASTRITTQIHGRYQSANTQRKSGAVDNRCFTYYRVRC
jgi:hypothetical protein